MNGRSNEQPILAENDGVSRPMQEKLTVVARNCTRCDLCRTSAHSLGNMALRRILPTTTILRPRCTRKCLSSAAVWPLRRRLPRKSLITEMRREAVRRGDGDFPEHGALVAYERRGASRRYSYYALPQACETVFFPGCALSGTRSEKVILACRKLQTIIPTIGIVLDCCMKTSRDLGREAYFAAMFNELKTLLVDHGVKTVLVACPNCYKIFAGYGAV
jgi:hypothetical protein